MTENQPTEQPINQEPIKGEVLPQPFCECWHWYDDTEPGNPDCDCGEEIDYVNWRWELPTNQKKWVELHDDDKQVVFHPFYSSGTAIIRGDTGMELNKHYYFEVKMLTEPYGTDIMVGIGSDKLDMAEVIYDYKSYLGETEDSYGISYTGAIVQNSIVSHDSPGFVKGTIVGVKVDLFRGTLEFYLNREPHGVVVTDLRKHQTLYPMMCSTTALSSLRLSYASSWNEALMIHAARVLADSYEFDEDEDEDEDEDNKLYFLRDVPPGLANILRAQFWMMLPTLGFQPGAMDEAKSQLLPASIRRKHWHRRW